MTASDVTVPTSNSTRLSSNAGNRETRSATTRGFVVQTCESRVQGAKSSPLLPKPDSSFFSPFETGDPFGVRKAVWPVFERTPEGALIGMGTAVHVDGWGGCLTAEHVIEFLRAGLPSGGLSSERLPELDPSSHSHAVVMLGIGLVFGTVSVPQWAFAPVTETLTPTRRREDPMAALRGDSDIAVGVDVAGFQVLLPAEASEGKVDPPKTLPVQLTGWTPTIGETVLALGYPELKPSAVVSDATLRVLVEDGLFAAYGTITRLFPEGRDRANPTPVFEVEANWPSGMSGGPVINKAGHVVGLVSRSLAADGDSPGIGYAACLPWIREVSALAPRIDPDNPGFRIGYTVRVDAQSMHGVWPTSDLALRWSSAGGSSPESVRCSNRIGTDESIICPWPQPQA